MSFFKSVKDLLFAAPKVATDVFDKDDGLLVKAGGFINGLNFSDQERATTFAELCKAISEHIKSTLSESTERSQTRRSISILWIKVQLALVLMVAISIPFSSKIAEQYFKLATCDVMLWGTCGVLFFFFGAYGLGTHILRKAD